MRSRAGSAFSCIKIEGGFFPQDFLTRLSAGEKDLSGMANSTYHIGKNERLSERINSSWNRMLGSWQSLKDAVDDLPEGSAATGPTRERWLLPLFQELGYGYLPLAKAREIDGKDYYFLTKEDFTSKIKAGEFLEYAEVFGH